MSDGSELWRWDSGRWLLSLRTHEDLVLLETNGGSFRKAKSVLVVFDVRRRKETRSTSSTRFQLPTKHP